MATYSCSGGNGITYYGAIMNHTATEGQLDIILTDKAAEKFGFSIL
jgi:hypothetical protein